MGDSKLRAFGIGLALVGLAVAPPAASAATINVNTTADEHSLDNGRCGLREAVQSATSDSVAGTGCVASGAFTTIDTVNLPAGTYSLSGLSGEDVNAEGDIDVTTGRVLIQHGGIKPAVVEGTGLDRVFHVLPAGGLLISGLVVRRGDAGTGGAGGGIRNEGFLAVEESTIRDNVAELGGGIAAVAGSTGHVSSSTISGNRSNDTGGGYHQLGGTADINNVTLTNNTADADGAGSQGGGGLRLLVPVNIHDTIIAGNHDGDPTPVNAPDCSGAGSNFVSEGDNLVQTPCSGAAVAAGDILGVGAKLGPLADNGGPTPTHALLKGSPAINAGGPLPDCPNHDQRFVPRTTGLCDIGPYERVLCARRLVNRVGTDGKDRLHGTKRKDGIIGLGGRDILRGLGGADGICGGPGPDILFGGRGNDRLRGQAGRDRLIGGPGRDRLNGGPGRDRLLQ